MLQLENIYAGYGQTEVLRDVSLNTQDRGIVSILGHNGAGKSTLLRTAVGLIKPSSGKVIFKGEDITGLPPHKRVRKGMAYVPQGQLSFEQLTTLENLQVVADQQGGVKPSVLVDEALDRFPALKAVLGRHGGLLSGGQRQQLAIARALITRPEFLILDEPTEGIQPNVVAEIQATVRDLAREGMSILLVEQHVGFALSESHTYYIMAGGRIVKSAPAGIDAQSEVRSALAI
ncbi:ATP-binding cassette domain-containing protein [Corynebacterium flavescens]|uniref:ATP-binding cassette domain-containing protein n=1 Tax=Corynebacterium flavescens TaxID=28028 RepID=UPI0028A29E24|nr:ATP-binding cassette domain-containing protein [Corynebacterium flavescens]